MTRYSPYRDPKPPKAFDPGQPRHEAKTIEPDALEVTLSKSEGAAPSELQMQSFLAELSAWAERMATKGYTIVPDPDEGPGTMRWRAVR